MERKKSNKDTLYVWTIFLACALLSTYLGPSAARGLFKRLSTRERFVIAKSIQTFVASLPAKQWNWVDWCHVGGSICWSRQSSEWQSHYLLSRYIHTRLFSFLFVLDALCHQYKIRYRINSLITKPWGFTPRSIVQLTILSLIWTEMFSHPVKLHGVNDPLWNDS